MGCKLRLILFAKQQKHFLVLETDDTVVIDAKRSLELETIHQCTVELNFPICPFNPIAFSFIDLFSFFQTMHVKSVRKNVLL